MGTGRGWPGIGATIQLFTRGAFKVVDFIPGRLSWLMEGFHLMGQQKKSRPVTLAFASHLLSPTMSESEIGGEPATR